ncbi:MAG: flagellar biosynthetic protein FliO [Lachnospiraceae bacterium]|nr:flagellar biosynthetic protein FliO [Lachnospiraceae bacterium]
MLLSTFDGTNSVLQFLTLLFIFIFIIGITYFTVRWMGRIGQGQSKYSNIEVIETRRITNNKFLQIIKAGDKYLLISVGKDEINMISELNGDSLELEPENSSEQSMSFSSILDKARNLTKKDLNDEDKEQS